MSFQKTLFEYDAAWPQAADALSSIDIEKDGGETMRKLQNENFAKKARECWAVGVNVYLAKKVMT